MTDEQAIAIIAAIFVSADQIQASSYALARDTASDGSMWLDRESLSKAEAIDRARTLLHAVRRGGVGLL